MKITKTELLTLKEACEKVFNINELHSPCRDTNHAFARHVYHHLLKYEYLLSELEISRLPSARDRSTIYSSIRTACDMLDTDMAFRNNYNAVFKAVSRQIAA